MHLKTENICLKTCVEISMDEKVCGNMCNVVSKLKTFVWVDVPNGALFSKSK